MDELEKQNIEDIFALTPMQEGMLYHYLKSPRNDQYFEQLSLGITGKVDVELFERAWDFVIETNDMMRTVFRWEKLEKPVQITLKEHKFKLAYYDFSGKDVDKKQKCLEKIKAKDRKKQFNLREVSFRLKLCKVEEKNYEVIISNHHILYDGWSNGIILEEFFKSYLELCKSEHSIMPSVKPKPPFKDFIKWIQNRDRNKQEQFWKGYLEGLETQKKLPIAQRKNETTKGTENYQVILKQDIKNKLEDFVKNNKVTLASLFYSAWALLLQKYCNSGDVIFGTTVSGRSAPIKGIEDMVGLFINTIPLRVNAKPGEKIKDLPYRINDILRIRERYENTPLVDIKVYSGLENTEELFDSIIVLQNYPLARSLIRDNSQLPITVDSYSMVEATTYDLTVGITIGEDIGINFSYPGELFEKTGIQRLFNHFTNIIKKILREPEGEISGLEILLEEEKNQLLYDFNNIVVKYPKDKKIHKLFEEQTQKTPDNIALIFDEKELTYRELNNRINQLAHLLQSKGVEANAIVGLIVERSVEMIIGILGILAAGGAYLPIDSESPEERIKYMLADSGAGVLVTTPKPRVKSMVEVKEGSIKLIDISNEISSSTSTLSRVCPANLAYIIYTSGSTGNPKGVLVTHANLSPLLHWGYQELGMTPLDRALQNLSYFFDWSVWEIFIILTSGASLYMAPREILLDPEACASLMVVHAITVLHVTPSQYTHLVKVGQEHATLKYLFIGAEKLTVELVERSFELVNDDCRVFNMYGPSECTIISAVLEVDRTNYHQFHELNSVPIGRPMANIMLLILNKYLQLCPVNIAGELYIAGDGLAPGYLNDPEKTSRSFIKNKYECEGIYGNRLYKTGDRVRWLKDANIEFLGRMDHQVKIRGFRIELGEIESQLLKHEEIREAVVLAKDDEGGDKYLAAYIVPAGTPLPGLREYLLKFLPDYMVPSYFMPLDEVPLTPTGKIDCSALPSPGIGPGEKYTAPGDEVERRLAGIWEEVLPLSAAIGIDGNFFQLGGHSLKAMTLLAKVHKAFNVKLPLSEIFKRPSIRRLSQYIRDAIEEQYLSIETAEKKECYALSSAQQRLYLLQQMDEAGMAYNMPFVWVMEGDVDKARFRQTFKELIHRHESFRTSFIMVDDKPVQRIHDEVEFEIEYDQSLVNGQWSLVHCQGRGEVPSPIKVEKIIRNFIRPFDLSETPLLRVGLVLLKEQKHLLMVDMHHIISDGMSVGILVQDFVALYSWDTLPVIRIHYKDYTVWQSREKERERIREQGEYWEQEFEGEIPIFEFPIDYARPSIQIFEGNSINFEISSETTGALKALTLESGTTLYMVLVAIYHVFLSKISSQEDIVVGTPVSGHRHADLEKIIGMFVNTLALRNYPSGEKKFTDFLEEVKEKTLKAFDNQDYPYEDLVEQVSVTRDTSRNPLFDTMFVLQNAGIQTLEIPGLNLVPYEYENKTSKFDLTLTGIESGEKMLFTFEYSIKLFKRETIERFIVFFMKVVKGIIENKHRKISEIEIIPDEEKTQVLVDFNSTTADYPKDKTIHALFEEQAERTSDHVALIGKNSKHEGTRGLAPLSITYRQLNKKSTRLADVLREKGAKPGTIVGIMLERSVEMIIGILGILKADGAYLPIDPEYPEERKQYMLDDSDAGVLITRPDLSGKHKKLKIVNGQLSIVNCQRQISRTFEAKKDHLHLSPAPATCLAYILYTSGSTGRPKGVLIRHGSVVNVLTALFKRYPFCSGDTYLLKTSYTFDVSVTELFGWFLGGGRLAILKLKGERDPGDILETIERCAISHINFVPSMFGFFLETLNGENLTRLSSLKYIFLAGEALLPVLVKRLMRFNSGVLLENIYGPTESTIYASNYSLSGWKGSGNIPIGKPLPNIGLYILDKYDHLQPVGVAGELCISGQGLAVGYLNQPGLTEEKFVFSPFLRGERLYRTGDLARWLSDGNIEFLGRLDQQVKVRGFRIELGEIENQLLNHDEVREAVVSVKNDKREDKYLFAYIVSHSPGSFESNGLRSYLQEKLPGYMVPVYFVELEEMPLTAGGKIDKRSLPEPGITPGRGYIAPRNASEELLVNIWIEVLAIDNAQIGIDDNFFELGGNSLKAIRLISKIHKEFNREIPLREMFNKSTVRAISLYLDKAESNIYRVIESTEKKEYYHPSSAQKRLYILQQVDLENTSYNLPKLVVLEGKADLEKLNNTFRKLIERHEILRTSFEIIEDGPVQRIQPEAAFAVEYFEVENREEIEKILKDFIRAFDLSKAPLVRTGVIKIDEVRYILMVDLHHIITDRKSHEVLVQDFITLFEKRELPGLRLQYKDFSEWQTSLKRNRSIKQQEKYWLKVCEDAPTLIMPIDFSRPAIQSFEGDTVHFTLEKQESNALKKIALEEGITIYMLFLAIFNVLLSKICRQQDIVVGTPVSSRRHADLEKIIGMFVNTLALRNYPQGEKRFKDFLKEVKERTLEAFENQDYPFEFLVNKLKTHRDISRNPLFDVMFSFIELNGQILEKSETLSHLSNVNHINHLNHDAQGKQMTFKFENNVSRFDLTLTVVKIGEDFFFDIIYRTKLFNKETIEKLVSSFKNLVSCVIENPENKISGIKLISKAERDEILVDSFVDLEAEYA